jgi:hypothetical protein
MNYPKHLEEKIRIELAISYLKHELHKIFPSISNGEIENIIYCKELSIPRDFWNGVHGIGMGFKLHIGFIYLVTAENIVWTKELIEVDSLSFGVDREMTKLTDDRSVKSVKKYFAQNPEVLEKYTAEFRKKWVDDVTRESDPIVVNEKNGGLAVYEGNGRLEKLVLDQKMQVQAYVGRYSTSIKRPKNYWLPTSLLMDVLLFIYQAIDNNEDELFIQQIVVLKDMLKDSESGRVEFLERALTTNEKYRKPILSALSY